MIISISELSKELVIVDKELISSIRWNKKLGTKLKTMRGKESMQSLAARAGCVYQLIQHLERGEYPNSAHKNTPPSISMEKLEGICGALNISIEDFLECPSVKIPPKFQQ